MKKYFLFFIFLFFISLVQAAEFDNVKYERTITFDGKKILDNPLLQLYRPIEIKNAFGLGSTLFEGYLSQHDYTCGVDCQSIMEIKISSKTILINDIRFDTLKDDGSWKPQSVRSYTIQYYGDVPNYVKECLVIGKTINDSNKYSCSRVLDGTKKGWIDYNIGQQLNAGTYTVRLNVKKKPSRTVDWIIKTNGEWLNEWATWGNISTGSDGQVFLNSPPNAHTIISNPVTFNASANLTGGSTLINISLWTNESGIWSLSNISLVSVTSPNLSVYYGFDQSSGTVLRDDSGNGFNGDNVNMDNTNWKAGIILNSLDFNGVDEYVNTTYGTNLSLAENLTISVWFNMNTSSANPMIWGSAPAGQTMQVQVQASGGDILRFFTNDAIDNQILGSNNVSDGLWHHVVLVRDTTADEWQFYEDGINIGNLTDTSSISTYGFAETPIFIGARNGVGTPTNFWNGQIDEMGIWNRSLNQSEITSLYNSGAGEKPGGITTFLTQTWEKTIFENIIWNVRACDSDGDCGFSLANRSLSFVFIENNQTFSTSTIEGNTESYSANITLVPGLSVTNANFIYNGVTNTGTANVVNGDTILTIENFVAPSVSADTNFSFLWSPILSDSNTINLTTKNQSVSALGLDNCSTFTNVLLNLTLIDETTQTFLNGSAENVLVEVDVGLFTADGLTQILNISLLFNETNPNAICTDVDLFNNTIYVLDTTVKYSSSGRAIEYYNIRDAIINNESVTQNITLFDIKDSESTPFQITFKNSNFIVVEDALIQVNRQFVSEGVFKTVELPITDSNGQTVVHLVEDVIVYNYIVTKDNVILGVFNNLIAFCDDSTIGQCFITLNSLEGTIETFNPDSGDGISFFPLVFNETSRDLSFTFTTNDGTVKNVTMSAVKLDQIGETNVCITSIVSSSATITCNVPSSFGNETIIVTVRVDGDIAFTSYFSLGQDLDLGFGGFFLLLFITVSLGLMFSESKSMIIVGVILGMITGALLFLTEGGIIAGGSAIIWLIIVGIILIWKLNSENQT